MGTTTLFRGIGRLVTMAGAAQKGGRRITFEDMGEIRKAAFVADRQGRVIWTGPERALTAQKVKDLVGSRSVREVSIGPGLVIPGFTDCHTHLIFAGHRAAEFEMRNQGLTYQQIAERGGGIRSTVTATRKASEAELLRLAQARVERAVAQGVTALEVKSGYGLRPADEAKILKVARRLKGPKIVATYLGLHARPPEPSADATYVDEVIGKTLPTLHRRRLVDRVDVFVEQGYFSIADADRLMAAARELNLPVTVHADQLTRTGISAHAASAGAVSVDHVIQVTDADVAVLAGSQTVCVLLPSADFYLRMAYPPARKLIDSGACVALATDFNPGTSPTQDINFVGLLARLEMKMSLPEVLSAWTVGAARALGLASERGSIEKEKDCDFIHLDCELEDLFHSVGSWPVRQVWRRARRLYSKPNALSKK